MEKEPKIHIEILEPALKDLSRLEVWKIRCAIGAQAIRLGLCQAMVVPTPDDLPNCFVNFWDKNFGSHINYHLDVKTCKLVRPCDLKLPEPTQQPYDPPKNSCSPGGCCNC